ncbi:hypothetical protein [Helicobacter canis]|uniref:Glycosyltransferase RgtA/B/C/D-like domain-containing protein n=1 Tax=Helicobacter canis NCTC 12740 TaxID=1357399 RepID=V8CHE0_9HELI|nr:hypothetical protein [Helicobacter canis]ETD26784.1 hypothetical protein HMPREF2087_01174 [Helicobacter canis NCTC 12740]
MRLTLQAYFVICLVIAAAAIVLKPIYTKTYANVPNAFAPTHIAIATTSPCEAYALSASTNKIALDYDKMQEPFRFYTIANPSALESNELDSSSHICALARNAITAPLTSLRLRASKGDLDNIAFVAITMGSESFYIPRDSVLGNHSLDLANFGGSQTSSLVSPPKFAKSYESTTAIPRILEEEKGARRENSASSSSRAAQSGVAIHKSAKVDSRQKAQTLESSQTLTLDLSSYKLHPSSEILNLYGSTIFDSIYLGFLYYFLSPQFLFIWLMCAWVFIALKPKRQNLAAKYKELIALALLLALALILRLYHYDSFSLWGDELYSVGVVGYPDGDFASVFKDPGNPPFYNFLLKLWLHCFGYTSGAARGLSVVIGTIGVIGIYLLLRDHACENSALSSHRILEESQSAPELSSRAAQSGVAIHSTNADSSLEAMDCHAIATALARNDRKNTATNLNELAKDSRILELESGFFKRVQGRILGVCNRSTRAEIHDSSPKAESTKKLLIPTLGAFFYAISFVAIGAAHEVRGYVLELALLPFVFYFLLHFLKNPRLSNALGYVLLGAMVCNTHYFGAVMILAGFIASAILLWQATELSRDQKRKRLVALLLLDMLIASSLVPFFAITAFSQALSDTSFNTWIPAPSLNGLLQFLPQAFGGSSAAFVFIVAFLLTPMLKNRFLNFCAIVIALGVLLPFIASFVRPIYYPKYAVYATYAFMLALCATAIVLFARKVAGKNASFLIALLVCMLSVSLLDHRVQPIGVGDNTRAKFRFITLDSSNEANKSSAKPRIYIIDLHTAMATKQRQYEIYGFKPSAEFLRISVPELEQRHFHKGDILYLDGYFIDSPTMQAVLSTLSAKRARIQPIPFGIQEERDLKESQDLIYKVIF